MKRQLLLLVIGLVLNIAEKTTITSSKPGSKGIFIWVSWTKSGSILSTKTLHAERIKSTDETVTYDKVLNNLPHEVYVSLQKQTDKAFLVWYGALWQWTPDGYTEGPKVTPATKVNLLTPTSTVNAIRVGFQPVVALSKFHQKSMAYYNEDGMVYWTMGAPLNETIIRHGPLTGQGSI